MKTKAIRLLGKFSSSAENGDCNDLSRCPAIMETEDGNFLVVGKKPLSPPDLNGFTGIADDEQVVIIPKELLLMIKDKI